ncbi:MAG: TMEM175 family protein [Sciscionella sp.]
MRTSRLEAFSDGVLAIVITVMVLELHVPHGSRWADLWGSGSGLLTYLLSFVYIGIYWSNHHHLFQLVRRVTGEVLWANLHLLFWLSLVPFTTSWVDDERFAAVPTVVYGIDLLAAAVAYYLLQITTMRAEGERSLLHQALGRDLKGKVSPVIYLVGILLGTLVAPWLAVVCYVVVAVLWLVPDRRLERFIEQNRVEPA